MRGSDPDFSWFPPTAGHRDRLSRSEQQSPARGAHMHRYLRLFALTTTALAAAGSNAQTPPPAIEGPVYVATYVEVLPNAVRDGTALLKQYRDATRKDAGNQRAEVVEETNRPTRF